MTNTTKHYTAWLTNVRSALDQPNMDITILEDEAIGDPENGDGTWACAGGEAVYYTVTDMAADDYWGDCTAVATNILRHAGWDTTDEWTSNDTGYAVSVSPNTL